MYSYLPHFINICFIDKQFKEEKVISSHTRLDIETGKDKLKVV